MINIYYTHISEELHQQLMQKYVGLFSKDFSDRLFSYRRWQDAQLSLLGRLLLKYGFEKNEMEYFDHDLFYTQFKKPFYKNKSLHFNISHSGAVVICAISDDIEVGIDIEEIRNIDIADYKAQMTSQEWKKVSNANLIVPAFYDYWTQKEAVAKANGHGLSIPLKSFEVIDGNSQIDNEKFYVRNLVIGEDYKCHVAFKNENPPKMAIQAISIQTFSATPPQNSIVLS